MAEYYDGAYTGQQIDAAVGAALNPDTTPTAASDALITSGGVKSAISDFARAFTFGLEAGKTATITFDTFTYFLLFSTGFSANLRGLYCAGTTQTATGNTLVTNVNLPIDLSVSGASGAPKVTITNNNASVSARIFGFLMQDGKSMPTVEIA